MGTDQAEIGKGKITDLPVRHRWLVDDYDYNLRLRFLHKQLRDTSVPTQLLLGTSKLSRV